MLEVREYDMTDLAEIRRHLSTIDERTARTAQDVVWIRDGLERGSSRMDEHGNRIGKLENGNHKAVGFTGALGMAIGIVAGALGIKLGIPPH